MSWEHKIMKQVIQSEYRRMHYLLSRAWQTVALLLVLGWSSLACAQVVGTVTNLSGVLTARHPDGSTRVMASRSEVLQGDTLVTQSNTYARVKFMDDGEIVLRPGSEMVVKSYLYDADKPERNNVAIGLVKGGLRAVTGLIGKRNHDAVSFDTPTATIGIRGTHFGALFCQNDCGSVPTKNGSAPVNGLYVDVAQGAVVVSNPAGAQVYQAGQFGYVANLNTAPLVVPTTQGIQVTMPQSISANKPGTKSVDASLATACIM